MERDAARGTFESAPADGESGLDALRASGAVHSSFVPSDRHDSNEHIALIYETRSEQFAVAVPFVRQGLERGEKCIYVADDGPGVPEAERGSIFEPGTTSADGGTGFGLAIVRRIAEAHGWTVTVTDAPDGGARFEVTDVEPAP